MEKIQFSKDIKPLELSPKTVRWVNYEFLIEIVDFHPAISLKEVFTYFRSYLIRILFIFIILSELIFKNYPKKN